MTPPFGSLANRRAMVTGSSSGIGRAVALELARAGADVLVHCRASRDTANTVAEEIRSLGRRAEVLTADFADPEACVSFVATAWDAFGGVDVWVNNAGADLLTGEVAQRGYREKLQTLLDVDVRSSILLAKAVGQRMQQAGSGAILTIGWDQAERGMAGDSGELFAAAKAAVMGFTRSLAVSLAPDVRVNCIAPGWIRTQWGEQAGEHWQQRVLDETPLQRWGTPEDVAKIARFLASDEAAYITGQIVNVNGGAER